MTDATEGLRLALEASEADIARLREENAALRAQNAYLAPRRRAGQLVANALYALDPEFYEAHRGTGIDPFNHDESVVDYLRAWRESERVTARKYLATSDAWDVIMGELEAFKARHVEAWWHADGYAALSDRITAAGTAKLAAKRVLIARIGRTL